MEKEKQIEDLKAQVNRLQAEIEKVNTDRDFWINKALEADKRFQAFRDTVKGMIMLME